MSFHNPHRSFAAGRVDAYSQHLHDYIAASTIGASSIILNAADYFPVAIDRPGPAFELSSGRHQREFLTLWELFRNREQFHKCIAELAARAMAIYAATPFSVILTCTETAKCLMEHLHSELPIGDQHLELQYLGHYPHLGMENQARIDVCDRSVLLLTDVVARGTLIRQLAEVAQDRGGKPVGALAVALTDETLIATAVRHGHPPYVPFGRAGNVLPVHSLTRYPITELGASDFDPERVLKIDPVTVLPEERLELSERFSPAFSSSEMYGLFDETEAVAFGLFEVDARWFTTAIRLDRVLERAAEPVWSRIRERLESDGLLNNPTIVVATTFDREDMRFKEYVEDQLRAEDQLCADQATGSTVREFVFIPVRDSLASAKSYFLLPDKAEEFTGKHVLLLLASVHTAEKLTNLSSLIASQAVESITAVCLLNRMGPDTDGFVSRVERLLNGLGKQRAARFHFVPIFTLYDLRSNDLAQVYATFESMVRSYQDGTRVPRLRRWGQRALTVARPETTSSPAFHRSHPTRMPSAREFRSNLGDEPVLVRSYETMLSMLCSAVVTHRDYSRLLETIDAAEQPSVLFKLLLILFADLSYLKTTPYFTSIREGLIGHLRDARTARFALENDVGDDTNLATRLRSMVDHELDVLLVLCALAYFDERYDYTAALREAITCGVDADVWRRHPENALYYYGYERTTWTISVLLHLGCPEATGGRRDNPSVAADVASDIARQLGYFAAQRRDPSAASSGDVAENLHTEEVQRIRASLEMLAAEMRPNERRAKHQLMRFLHSLIITTPRRHSSIETGLMKGFVAIESEIERAGSPEISSPYNRLVSLPQEGEPALRLKLNLEDAIHASGTLQEIADVAQQWLYIAPTNRAGLERFAHPASQPGFARDVQELGDFLQSVRTSLKVWTQGFQEAAQLRTRLLEPVSVMVVGRIWA